MKNDRGFTLIELIMVIATIGILAFVVMSKSSTTVISLGTAADMVKSDIRSVQALAMAQHTSQSLTFGSNVYDFPKLGGGTQTRNLDNIFNGQISLSAPGVITFNSLGEPTTGESSITISNGGSHTLTVLQYTGKVQ